MTQYTLKANAKINLTLAVTGIRGDGYHFVDTIMQSLDFFDTVRVKKNSGLKVLCGVQGLAGEDNICFNAACVFFEETGVSGGAEIEIEKRIPDASGLGGGSSNATAVLYALNRIYGTGLTDSQLCDAAIKVGADVPFFIKGGTQRARGIGEQLESLPAIPDCGFVIAKTEEKPSTGELYRRLDKIEIVNPNVSAAVSAIYAGDLSSIAKSMGNCFSPLWDLSALEESFSKDGLLGISLSGSGPAVFGMYESTQRAQRAAEILIKQGIMAYCASPAKSGLEFV